MFKKLKQKIVEELEADQSPSAAPSNHDESSQSPLGAKRSSRSLDTTPLRPTGHSDRGKTPSAESIPSGNSSANGAAQKQSKSTPQQVLARVNQLLEAGKSQDVNNGEQATPGEVTPPQNTSTPSRTPSRQESTESDTPRRGQNVPPSSPGFDRSDAESDAEHGTPGTPRLEMATKEELVTLYRKQDRVLARYKTRFSEVVNAYKTLQKDNEKLQANLTQTQDKALRRISEMKETIELEKQAKMHLEETLRLSLDEKEDIIRALQTQNSLLKQSCSFTTDSAERRTTDAGLGSQSDEEKLERQRLVDRVDGLQKELNNAKEHTSVVDSTAHQQLGEAKNLILRLEQEKKVAIEDMMTNMQVALQEKDDAVSESAHLRKTLQSKEFTIEEMKKEKDEFFRNMEKALEESEKRREIAELKKDREIEVMKSEYNAASSAEDKDRRLLMEELKREKAEVVAIMQKDGNRKLEEMMSAKEAELQQALTKKEKDMEAVISNKEEHMKKLLEKKVKEIEIAVDEKELQKEVALKEKEKELQQVKNEREELNMQLQYQKSLMCKTEEEKAGVTSSLQNDIQRIMADKHESDNRVAEMHQKIAQEQEKMKELIQQHNNRLKEKQDEHQKNLVKMKKGHQNKVSELTESTKRAEQRAAESEKLRKADQEKHTKGMEAREKELESVKQTELARLSKRMESKTNEMKKIVKELRTKLSEKENQAKELEQSMKALEESSISEKAEASKQFESKLENMKKVVHELRQDVTAKEQMLKTLEESKATEVANLAKEYDGRLKEKEREIIDFKGKFTEKEYYSKELEKKLREMKDLKDKELEVTRKEAEIKVQAVEEQFGSQKEQELLLMQSEREKHVQDAKSESENYKQKNNELNESLKAAIESEQRVNQELSNLKKTYDEEMNALRGQLQADEQRNKEERLMMEERNLAEVEKIKSDAEKRVNDKNVEVENVLKNFQDENATLQQQANVDFETDKHHFEESLRTLKEEKLLLEEKLKQEESKRQQTLEEAVTKFNDEKLLLEEKQKSEFEKLRAQLEGELNEKEKDIETKDSAMKDLQQQNKNMSDELTSAGEMKKTIDELSNSITLRDEKITKLKEQLKQTWEKFKEKEKALKEEIEEKERVGKELVAETEKVYQQKLSEKDEIVKNRMDELMQQKELSVHDVTSNLEQMHREQIASLDERHNAEIAEQNLGWEKKVTSVRKEGEEVMEKFINESREKEDALTQDIVNLKNELKNREKLSQQNEEELQSGIKGLMDEKETLESKVREVLDESKQLKNELSTVRNDLDCRIMEMVENHRLEVNDLTTTADKRLEELLQQHEHDLENENGRLKDMHMESEKTMKEMLERHRCEVEEIRNSYDYKMQETSETRHSELAQMKDIYEKQNHEMEKLRKHHNLEIEELNKTHAKQLADITKVLEESKASLADCETKYREEIEFIRKKHAEETEGIKTSLNQEIIRLTGEEDKLKGNHKSVEESFSERIHEIERKAQEEITSVTEHVDTLKAENAKQVEEQSRLAEENKSFTEQADKLRKELAEMKEEHAKEIEGFAKDAGDNKTALQEKMVKMKKKFLQIKSEFEEKLSAKEKSEAELKQQNVELENSMTQKIAEMEGSHAKSVEELNRSLEEIKVRFAADEKHLRAELEKKEVEAKQMSETASTSIEAQLKEQNEAHGKEIQTLEDKWGQKCTEIEKRYSTQIENLLTQQQHEAQTTKEQHESTLAEIKTANDQKVAELGRAYEENLAAKDKSECELKQQYLDLENNMKEKMVEMEGGYAKNVEGLTRSIEELRVRFAAEEKQLRTELEKKTQETQQTSDAASTNLETQLKEHQEAHRKEIQALEDKWGEKCTEIEKRYSTQIENLLAQQQNEAQVTKEEHETALAEMKALNHQKIADIEEAVNARGAETESTISELQMKLRKAKEKIKAGNTRHEEQMKKFKAYQGEKQSEVNGLRERVKVLENELLQTSDSFKKKLRDAEQREEELKLKIVAGENDNQTVDKKMAELHEEKQEVIRSSAKAEEEFNKQILELKSQLENDSKEHEEELNNKQQEYDNKLKEMESEKESALEKQSEEMQKQSRGRVAEMKKKAEAKIASVKKQLTTQLESKVNEVSKLKETLLQVETQIEELKAEHAQNIEKVTEEHTNFVKEQKQMHEKDAGERERELSQEVETLRTKVQELESTIEKLVIVKMDALRQQKDALKEEHAVGLQKITKDYEAKLESMERLWQAKLDEKDFDHSSQIKQLLREFHMKYGEKERELQDTVSNAIDVSQREENLLKDKYEVEIREYRKELKMREDEMLAYKQETDQRLADHEREFEEFKRQHAESLQAAEADYHNKVQEMVTKNEEDMENLHKEHRKKLEEQQDVLRLDQKSEVAAVEKKLKTQMKKNQNEMKKLLNHKEALLQAHSAVMVEAEPGQLQRASSASSLNEAEPDPGQAVLKDQITRLRSEVSSLKERETSLKRQIETLGGSPVKGFNERPAQLNLQTNPLSPFQPAPASPVEEPMQFEYMRNILYEYMMGRQRKQLAKVLSAVVKFTPKQERQIMQKEDELVAAQAGLFSPQKI